MQHSLSIHYARVDQKRKGMYNKTSDTTRLINKIKNAHQKLRSNHFQQIKNFTNIFLNLLLYKNIFLLTDSPHLFAHFS